MASQTGQTQTVPEAFKTFQALTARPATGQVVTAWRNLLSHYFPEHSDFKVLSKQEEPASYQAISFVSVLDVEYGGQPVLVVNVNNPEHFVSHSARQAADDEIRALVKKRIPTCPIPTLYGISVFGQDGTKYRLYKTDREDLRYYRWKPDDCDVEPCPTSQDPHVYNNVPEEAWDQDVFDQKGQNGLLDILDYIQLECIKTLNIK